MLNADRLVKRARYHHHLRANQANSSSSNNYNNTCTHSLLASTHSRNNIITINNKSINSNMNQQQQQQQVDDELRLRPANYNDDNDKFCEERELAMRRREENWQKDDEERIFCYNNNETSPTSNSHHQMCSYKCTRTITPMPPPQQRAKTPKTPASNNPTKKPARRRLSSSSNRSTASRLVQLLLVQMKSSRGERGAASSWQHQLHRHTVNSMRLMAFVVLLVALIEPFGLPSAASNNGLRAMSTSNQQQHQQQLELLRSANVELTRSRSQRLQRDTTSPAPAVAAAAGPPTSDMGVAANPTSSSATSAIAAGSAATCGYPGSPAHASVSFNMSSVVAGTAASYTCDNGYELLGPPRRICQPNGTWSPVGIPFCVLNVGLGKAAMQSSTAGQGSAQKAVDGSTSPYFQASTCTMTDVENNPWWYVNLLEPYLVQIVRIDFGTACCANRQKATIAVRVGNNRPDLGNNPLCNRYHGFIEEGKPLFLPCTRPAPGAFVSIHLESPSGSSLSICETFIYTDHALSIEQCPSFRDQPLGSTATYNGKCYLFHNNQALNFDQARKYCESRGGSLVDETSPALQGFLSWELYRRHRNDQLMGQYWLGAMKDARTANNWKWINGKDVQISFWNSLATQGNCSRFDGSKGWLWSATDCSTNLNFICQYRPLSCGKPEKPTNSTLVTKNIDNGTVIEYQCAPGNMLMGPKSRACLPTGFFSEFAPKCKYLDCQFPAQIPNGDYKLLNGTTSFQSVVNYYCQDGYQLYGKAMLTCDVDERWNGPPPRCEPLLCPAPVPPSNGYVTLTANVTTPGTQATYDCRPGYELVGDHLLTCSQSGSWDNSFPFCREKRSAVAHATSSSHVNGAQPAAATPLNNPAPPSAKPAQSTRTNPLQQAASVPPSPSPPSPPPQPSSSSTTTSKPHASGGGVHFPSGSNVSGAGRTTATAGSISQSPAATSSSTAASTNAITTTSLPAASLNGLTSAGSFGSPTTLTTTNNNGHLGLVTSTIQQQQQQQAQVLQDQQASTSNLQEQNRKASQSSSVSQFVLPPQSSQAPPSVVEIVQASHANGLQPQVMRVRPANQVPSASTSSTPTALLEVSTAGNNRQQQASTISTNKFTFNSIASSPAPTMNPANFGESTPLATNSISVHSPTINQQQQQQQHVFNSAQPASTTSSSTTTSTVSLPGAHQHTSQSGAHQQHQQHVLSSQQQNVLASFSPTPSRAAHNTLASAKYSLDGIIAVAIFGGFIFLGAIITIIVIIIRRRKSGHSSSIDAQTISTYDSNGERNGLYRNYQQAWENLRFATPSSQPKSSGGGGDVVSGGLMGAHVVGAPSVGLKNFSSPLGVVSAGNGLHAHQHLHHAAHHSMLHNGTAAPGGGHHNLALSGSTSSSQSSSSLGGGVVGAGGDPLLRGHNSHHGGGHHGHHLHSHALSGRRNLQQHNRQHLDETDHDDNDDEDDDDDMELNSPSGAAQNHYHADDTTGGLSSASYRGGVSGVGDGNEGFRDSNELTIGADQVVNRQQQQSLQQQQAQRRRLYSTNSIGRTSGSNRHSGNLSMGVGSDNNSNNNNNHHHLMASSAQANHQHQHHHHHHHPIHATNGSTGSSQHQRLVSSSTTPTTSTRSSRASPPSDDHSLDQLAYGNSWHPNAAGNASSANQLAPNHSGSQHDSTSGSGASILGGGGGGRSNMRY